MNENVRETYQKLLSEYQEKFESTKKQLSQLAWARLGVFISIFPSFIYLRHEGALATALSILLPLACFLWFVKKYIQKEKEKQFYFNLIEINKNELKALDGDFSTFEDGKEFTDIHHSYSFDLDLFGSLSFFQFINRSATIRGRNRLAKMLLNGEKETKDIHNKQQAVEELANELNWRQFFIAKGKTESDLQDQALIHQWTSSTFILKNERILQIILWTIPIFTGIAIGLFATGIVEWGFVVLFILGQWSMYFLYFKSIGRFRSLFGSRSGILSKYIDMLADIEKHCFQADYLKVVRQKLYFEEESASQISEKLKKRIERLEYGQNFFVSIILNSLLLWDIRCILHLSRWHRKYHNQLDQWFEVIAEFDALTSLANFNYNHPSYTLPLPVSNGFIFDASQLGHPMIDDRKRISNDFKLCGAGKLAIITGANMAGKSTFLRTVGVNLILAMNGCRVCARQMHFTPISLFTNMRTTDNLMNDESYFYAELLRLQQLLQRIRKGEKLFIIIDEMLKGTNSADKLHGSKELVKQLISLDSSGIIATHDLKLTELHEDYPQAIQNQCFEVLLHNDDLKFDYLLRNGVTKTMNASFLMKKMGIINK